MKPQQGHTHLPDQKIEPVIHECPQCDSPNLLREVDEIFCLSCDWNSIVIREEVRIQSSCRKRLQELISKVSESWKVQCEAEALKRSQIEQNREEHFNRTWFMQGSGGVEVR